MVISAKDFPKRRPRWRKKKKKEKPTNPPNRSPPFSKGTNGGKFFKRKTVRHDRGPAAGMTCHQENPPPGPQTKTRGGGGKESTGASFISPTCKRQRRRKRGSLRGNKTRKFSCATRLVDQSSCSSFRQIWGKERGFSCLWGEKTAGGP